MISILQHSIKEKQRRSLYRNSEIMKKHYKFMKMQSYNIGYLAINNLQRLRIRNLCLVSGHPRSVYSKHLRLSRHQIKHHFASIRGLRLSSW